ncbi:MAG TPA: hypothetical protein VGM82_22585 [Gemmatimonadaceae bacterium]|jgi:hypothetical protein
MEPEVELQVSLQETQSTNDKGVLAPLRVGGLTALGAGLGVGGATLAWLVQRLSLWSGWAFSGYGLIVGGLLCLAVASAYDRAKRDARASRGDNSIAIVLAIAAMLWFVGRHLI